MASLFDTPHIWKTSPVEGFKDFVQSPDYLKLGRRKPGLTPDGARRPYSPIRAGSAQVYVAMFTKFSRWLAAQDLDIYKVTGQQIVKFLDAQTDEGTGKVLNSAIRVRYLRMLERVYDHLEVRPNPAKLAAYEVHTTPGAAGRDQPKEFLSSAEEQAFMTALPETLEGDTAKAWKRRRDRAMLALMLGAGLKVSEVVGAYVENIGEVQSDGSVPITISPGSNGGISRWHETLLRPFAAKEVMAWLAERKVGAFHGKLLFPSTRDGKRLDATTVYLAVKKTMERAGIDARRRGGRTLRNTFAKRELEQGAPLQVVNEYMGHHELRSTEKYQ